MDILWIILIGFVAGLVARLIMPGPNKPMGFLVTTVLGIAGAFLMRNLTQWRSARSVLRMFANGRGGERDGLHAKLNNCDQRSLLC